jgi:hypothetical protein
VSEVNEINATFYAMRLVSHNLDISEIGISEGDEYPATEFTREEQARALQIVQEAQWETESGYATFEDNSFENLTVRLADRIEELANGELEAAGYSFKAVAEQTEAHPLSQEVYRQDLYRELEASQSAENDADTLATSDSRSAITHSESER